MDQDKGQAGARHRQPRSRTDTRKRSTGHGVPQELGDKLSEDNVQAKRKVADTKAKGNGRGEAGGTGFSQEESPAGFPKPLENSRSR